jgi:hypothetical protein
MGGIGSYPLEGGYVYINAGNVPSSQTLQVGGNFIIIDSEWCWWWQSVCHEKLRQRRG